MQIGCLGSYPFLKNEFPFFVNELRCRLASSFRVARVDAAPFSRYTLFVIAQQIHGGQGDTEAMPSSNNPIPEPGTPKRQSPPQGGLCFISRPRGEGTRRAS